MFAISAKHNAAAVVIQTVLTLIGHPPLSSLALTPIGQWFTLGSVSVDLALDDTMQALEAVKVPNQPGWGMWVDRRPSCV